MTVSGFSWMVLVLGVAVSGIAIFILIYSFEIVRKQLGRFNHLQKRILGELRRQRHEYMRPFILIEKDVKTGKIFLTNVGAFTGFSIKYEEYSNKMLSFSTTIEFIPPGKSVVVNNHNGKLPETIDVSYRGHEDNLEYSTRLTGLNLRLKTSVPGSY